MYKINNLIIEEIKRKNVEYIVDTSNITAHLKTLQTIRQMNYLTLYCPFLNSDFQNFKFSLGIHIIKIFMSCFSLHTHIYTHKIYVYEGIFVLLQVQIGMLNLGM